MITSSNTATTSSSSSAATATNFSAASAHNTANANNINTATGNVISAATITSSSLSGTNNSPIELQYGLFTSMSKSSTHVCNYRTDNTPNNNNSAMSTNSSSSPFSVTAADAARLAMCMLDDADECMCNFILLLHVDLQSHVISVSSSTGTYYNAL